MSIIGSMIMLLLQQNFLTIVPLLSQFQLFLTFGILKSL
ncbi:Phage protein [Streptococcus thermophilus MTCC 5460]|nr:Phage protein [Streptococcus thermophilus MTCC 5461]ELW75447.1 Phage protein [Streptococcus thermophilus MTCC 5460]